MTHLQETPDAQDIGISQNGVDDMFTQVYRRLKAMAGRQRIRKGEPNTLCTTELVHEVYLRMGEADLGHLKPEQFFAYAARAIRHVLTDAARRRASVKHGGDQKRIDMDDEQVEELQVSSQTALELDQALYALQHEDARAAQVLELYFFAGLNLQRIAEVLGISARTVDRDWNFARAFISNQMTHQSSVTGVSKR
jgi:RNA polymerase sigma factor (TIGR02999 family)